MKVIRRLKKLLAHQKSAQKIGNVAEAEAFAETIQKLLDKHNLSLNDIDSQDEESSLNREAIKSKYRAEKQWQFILLNEISKLNGCYSFTRSDGIQFVVGKEFDRQIVAELYLYFENLILEFGHKYADSFENTIEYFLTPTELKSEILSNKTASYLFGFTQRLCDRLIASQQNNIKAANSSTALIFLGNKSMQAKDWAHQQVKILPHDKPVEIPNKEAYWAGMNQGNSVALTNKIIKE